MKLSIDVSGLELIAIGIGVGIILKRLEERALEFHVEPEQKEKKEETVSDADLLPTRAVRYDYPTGKEKLYDELEIVLPSREDALHVVNEMRNILKKFKLVSVADLNDLVGLPRRDADNDWGWTDKDMEISICQVKRGYQIDLPDPEPVS